MVHTPGPWKLEVVWSDEIGSRLRGPDGRIVAELRSVELAEDLYLIAAAPELLEALEMTLGYISMRADIPMNERPRRRVGVIEQARIAIAKAKGEQ